MIDTQTCCELCRKVKPVDFEVADERNVEVVSPFVAYCAHEGCKCHTEPRTDWRTRFHNEFTKKIGDAGRSLGVSNVKSEIIDFIASEIQSAVMGEREEVLKAIRKYQNGFVREHYNGPDDPPQVEFAPEYGVIDELIKAINEG